MFRALLNYNGFRGGIFNRGNSLYKNGTCSGSGTTNLLRNYGQVTRLAVSVKDSSNSKMSNSHVSIPAPAALMSPIRIPDKLLMGPGPTNISPRVLRACTLQLGHMHQETFKAMDDIKAGLQYVFQTKNPWTLVVPGPGHLGMEAMLVNLLEPGDTVLVGVMGIWGHRCIDLAKRLGTNPVGLEAEMGKSLSLQKIEEGLIKHRPKLLFLVHSESSSGVMQPLIGVGDLCQKYNCLLAVDSVASLGGVPFYMDDWKIDAIYTGSQKVIGAPPGMSPVSFGARAVEKIKSRKTPIKSFLVDMTQLTIQWQCNDPSIPRIYHHTPPTNLLFGLREALAEIAEEGLENIWERHAKASVRLHEGLKSLGLKLFVANPSDRLPTVTTIVIPDGIDWKSVIQFANDNHKVEIAGGLGATVGKCFRIGLLGQNATAEKVDRVLRVFKEGLEFANYQKSRL